MEGFWRLVFYRSRGRRNIVALLVLVLASAALGTGQHLYTYYKFEQTVDQELLSWANDVAREVNYTSKWDLKGYERAVIAVPNYSIVTSKGLIVDIEGFVPGIFEQVKLRWSADTSFPQTLSTEVGQLWRVLAQRVDGGTVAVGIPLKDSLSRIDALLNSTVQKFGASLATARQVATRDVEQEIEFAVIDNDGHLISAAGGVPMDIKLNSLPMPLDVQAGRTLQAGGHTYRLFLRPISDSNGQPVGSVLVAKDIGLGLIALRDQDRFNFSVVGFFTVCLGLVALVAFAGTALRGSMVLSASDAISAGESKTVEFKSTYYWDPNSGTAKEERRVAVLRAIAGFLNAGGGTLFIGVQEDDSGKGKVIGLTDDIRLARGSADEMRLGLMSQISDRIGSQFAPFIVERIEEVQGQACWIIEVTPSPTPVFVRIKDKHEFFVREGPRTANLDSEKTWRYIKNHWG